MNNIKKYFRSNISDVYYEISKEEKPKEEILNTLFTDLLNELKEGKLQEKKTSFEKIFLIYLLSFNIKNFNFNILELLSSKELYLKQLGYILSGLTFDNDEGSLMMIQNILKRDLNSPNILNKSLALTFLAKFLKNDFFENSKKEILSIIKNNSYGYKENHMIQQKAYCCLKKLINKSFEEFVNIFDVNTFGNELIEEKNLSLLVSKLSLFEFENFTNESLYLIKPLFCLLDVKSSFILIKILKIFKKIIKLEKRIIPKLDYKFLELLNNYNYISTNKEIFEIIFEFDGFSNELMEKSFNIISFEITKKDNNIISMILEIFNKYLINNKNKEKETIFFKFEKILNIILKNLDFLFKLNIRTDIILIILLNLSFLSKKFEIDIEIDLISEIYLLLNNNLDNLDYFNEFSNNFMDFKNNISSLNSCYQDSEENLNKIFVIILPLISKKSLKNNKENLNIFSNDKFNLDLIKKILNNSMIDNLKKKYLIKYFLNLFFEKQEYLNLQPDEFINLLEETKLYFIDSNKFLTKIKINLATYNDKDYIKLFNNVIVKRDHEDFLDFILNN